MDIAVLIYILLIVAAAKILGEVVTRFNQPQIVGELLAGIVLGPFAIGFFIPQLQSMYSDDIVKGLADLGILFLMLIVGLEFNPRSLLKSSTSSLMIAVGGMMLPMLTGVAAALFLGLSGPAMILTLAVPAMASWVAVTNRPTAAVVCAVKTPLALMVPPLVVQVGVIATALPY